MTTIAVRLQAVRSRIEAAAASAGRPAGEIRLIAVSKTFPAAAIEEARAAGQFAFGESYLQEAVSKIAVSGPEVDGQTAHGQSDDRHSKGGLRSPAGVASPKGSLFLPLEWQIADRQQGDGQQQCDLRPSAGVASPKGPLFLPLEWHYIGPIQSNKTRQIAELFHWVHGVDRLKIAERLASSRPAGLPPLEICIQVNISGEVSKSGVPPEEAFALAQAIQRLRGVRLRGLMAIPEPTPDTGLQRTRFRQIRELKDEIVRQGIALDTLSMGMSDDLEAAIAEGATLVRVGRAIFGERPRNAD